MSRIVIILLLSTGAFCLLDQTKDGEVSKPEVKHDTTKEIPVSSEPLAQNEKLSADVPAKQDTPIETPKKAPVTLDKEQINLLAEKVIRIHGVDLESSDDDNLNNIAQLRNLVTNVEKDLNAKLKLSQEKKKLNLNKEDEVNDPIPPAQVQKDDFRGHDTDEEKVINENINTVNNIEENVKTVSEIEKRTSDINDELKNNLVDAVKTDRNEDINTETDSSSNISENQTIQQETEAESRDENAQNNSEDINTIPEEEKSDVKPQVEQSIHANEEVSDKDVEESEESRVEFVTVEKVKNETEEPIDEENVNESETQKQTEEDDTENEDDETGEANSDINDNTNVEAVEEESDIEKYEEDQIIDTCSLGDDCDQTDTDHKYSKEYNSENIQQEKLENIMEDSYLQSIIKYITSILN